MIKGSILNNRPLITITIGGLFYGVQDIVALVDTGFTGELKISPDKLPELGLQITNTQPVTLGDGRTINMSASLAYVGDGRSCPSCNCVSTRRQSCNRGRADEKIWLYFNDGF